jgi:hypothetical protein
VGGGVCYRLVSELLVETLGHMGLGLLVRVSWLRSNSDLEVENLRRNGIAGVYAGARTSEILCKGSKDHDHPFRIQERSPLWDQERSRIIGSEGR